jgi:hypothetical protein
MSKKLISLVLVLAVAGIANAANFYWNCDVEEGNWSVASNWKSGGNATDPICTTTPGDGDQAWIRTSSNGTYTVVTINGDTDATVSRLNMNWGTWTFNVQSGVTLTNNGTLSATGWQFYSNSGAVVNIDGTILNERSDTTGITVKIGGSNGGGSQTININDGGIMTVKNTSQHNGSFGIGTTATAAGSAYVNIASGGLLDVDSYSFGTLANKLMTIQIGGLMKVLGDATAQINADITAGYIVLGPGNGSLGVWKKGGYTYVPEPATIALLGLGSLMLLRRKR